MKCRDCAEEISPDVAKCPLCGATPVDQQQSVQSKATEKKSSFKGELFTAMTIGVIGLFVCGGLVFTVFLPLLGRGRARPAANRTVCKNNLHAIGLALHSYRDDYGTFPPAVTYDANGKPMHSWRVLILPYLGESTMYSNYRMDEPWDGPNNIRYQMKMPQVFVCPSSEYGRSLGTTSYAGISAPNSVLNPQNSVRLEEIVDGGNNTLMVVEVDGANIPWTEPRDLAYVAGMAPSRGAFWSRHTGGFQAALADGSVRFFSGDISPAQLQALTTYNGGETVGEF